MWKDEEAEAIGKDLVEEERMGTTDLAFRLEKGLATLLEVGEGERGRSVGAMAGFSGGGLLF